MSDISGKRRVPAIRFKGFTDDWEQRKLGDLVNVDTGSRNHQDAVQGGRYPFYVRSENIEALDEYDFDETAILVPGDGRIGEIFHFVQGKFALHQRVYKLDGFTGVMPEFLIQLLRHGFRKHALRMNAQGTVPSLRKPVFTEWQVLIPNTKEQKPISYLLRCLDKTIALHQRKYESLQTLKKELLRRLFASGKKKVPDFRFQGFTDEWEQRKLGDLVRIQSGYAPADMTLSNNLGDPMYIKVDDLNHSSRMQTSSELHAQKNSHLKVVTKGATIFPKRGAAIMTNKVRLLGTDAYMDTNMMALEPMQIDGGFLFSVISRVGLYKIADTSTIPQINNKHIIPYKINLPDKEEQASIAHIVAILDNTIALHQQQLENLKQLKKVLLQKLFV